MNPENGPNINSDLQHAATATLIGADSHVSMIALAKALSKDAGVAYVNTA